MRKPGDELDELEVELRRLATRAVAQALGNLASMTKSIAETWLHAIDAKPPPTIEQNDRLVARIEKHAQEMVETMAEIASCYAEPHEAAIVREAAEQAMTDLKAGAAKYRRAE